MSGHTCTIRYAKYNHKPDIYKQTTLFHVVYHTWCRAYSLSTHATSSYITRTPKRLYSSELLTSFPAACSALHSASRALSASVKWSERKASTHFYPGPSLRMSGAVTPLLHTPSWRVQGQCSMVKSVSYFRLPPRSRWELRSSGFLRSK